MTHSIIREQIKTIQTDTHNALKSKESARKFFTDAGIIKENTNLKPSLKKK